MARRLIGYSKLGRSLTLNDNPGFQGNMEARNLLFRLAARNPDVDFVIIGKRTKYDYTLPSNIIDPWTKDISDTGTVKEWADKIDGNIVHLGQHGTSHQPIPFVNATWDQAKRNDQLLTKPLMTQLNYGRHIMEMLNSIGDRTDGKAPVSYICTDPRNFFKGRDLKWPTGLDRILAQGEQKKGGFHERFKDPRSPAELGFKAGVDREGELWRFEQVYRHAGLELMILPDDWAETMGDMEFFDRLPFGVMTTSAWVDNPDLRRSRILRDYLAPFTDVDILGSWDDKSLAEIKPRTVEENNPQQFNALMASYRCTVALPPPARQLPDVHWTTSKPNQAFASGTACFFLGNLDGSGWMIPNIRRYGAATEVGEGLYSVRQDWTQDELHLARWLRVTSPADLHKKVKAVSTSAETYDWITMVQRNLLRRRWAECYTERIIENQVGLN